MMKLTLFCVLIVATTFLSTSVEGLAFVTGIMRPIVNPVAAAFRRQRQASAPTFLSTAATADEDVLAAVFATASPLLEAAAAPQVVFGSDASTRACRSEMLDLVYQRSLDRMDSFSQ